MKQNQCIRLVALQGSVRPNNNTAKALAIIAASLAENPGVDLDVIDPTDLDLRLPGRGTTDDATAIQARVEAADGVILATPEYHGSYSSVMKLMIDNLGFPSKLKGKPIALLGVAAGRIGAIKALEHLRSVASHVGGIVLPGAVSVARVRGVFDDAGILQDEAIGEQIRGVATDLLDYLVATTKPCAYHAFEDWVREVPPLT